MKEIHCRRVVCHGGKKDMHAVANKRDRICAEPYWQGMTYLFHSGVEGDTKRLSIPLVASGHIQGSRRSHLVLQYRHQVVCCRYMW